MPRQSVKRKVMGPKTPRPHQAVGRRIQELRRGMPPPEGLRLVTQKMLAARLDVSEGTVTAWENGYQLPEGENLIALARETGSRPEEILGEEKVAALEAGESAPAEAEMPQVLRELWRQLQEIDAHPTWSEHAKLLRREHALAAVREATQNEEARASVIRARAIEREAQAASGRAGAPLHSIAEDVTGLDARLESMRRLIRQELHDWSDQQQDKAS